MKITKYSKTLTLVTCLAVVLSLCCGILLADRASAAGTQDQSQEASRPVKVAQDLRERLLRGANEEKIDVILQLNGEMSNELYALLRSSGVKVKKRYANFNMQSIELPPGMVDSLASFPEVEFVSADSKVEPLGGHVAHTTGADDARTYATTGSFDGSGVGIGLK